MSHLRTAAVRTAAFVAAALWTGPRPLAAQDQPGRAQLLVSADWLAGHLQDPDLVLLHVGPEEKYQEEHIPGAHYLARDQMSHPGSHEDGALILELPDPEVLEATLEGFGVSDRSRILVYWGDEWVTPTARAVFTLDWAGLGNRTMLLDGGIEAWKAAGQPVTAAMPVATKGKLTLRPRSEMVVGADWVRQHATKRPHVLVDGRARAFYDGVREDRGKTGHIPGAGSIPWTELIDESLRLKSPTALREIFAAAGVRPGDTVVAYCHIGQYATLVLFSARILGHRVILYDGAFQDWATRDLPVVTGPGESEP